MLINPPAVFIADALGLDFLNTVRPSAPVEWIGDGRGLIDWLRQAKLAPSDALDEIAERAMPGELDRVAHQARDLREWFRGFVTDRMGRPLEVDALHSLTPLNRLLERDETYGRIAPRKDGDRARRLAYVAERRWRSPESLLIPIGEAMARVVTEDDFRYVKICDGGTCTRFFVDRTRARTRRWCSMEVCGNRAKVTAHRARVREA